MAESFTLICDGESRAVEARVGGGRVSIPATTLRDELGWELKPEGLCREDVCVPVRDSAALASEDGIDLLAFANALGRPLALDIDERSAALGRSAPESSARLASLEASDFSLPALAGRLHSLSDQRGQKVLLIAYASW